MKKKKRAAKPLAENSEKNPWKTLTSKTVFTTPWIQVEKHSVIQPSGGKGSYGVVRFQNIAVGVLAIDEENRVLLVGQYRYPLDLYSWELPEGGCPLGTRPLASAKRELREETGYRARHWSKILTLHLSNSVTDERAEIFSARGLTPGPSQPEETEKLKVKWVALKDAISQVKSGQITDAITVAALMFAASNSRE